MDHSNEYTCNVYMAVANIEDKDEYNKNRDQLYNAEGILIIKENQDDNVVSEDDNSIMTDNDEIIDGQHDIVKPPEKLVVYKFVL